MKILIDGRAFTASTAGISNFLKESVTAWARLSQASKSGMAAHHDAYSGKKMEG